MVTLSCLFLTECRVVSQSTVSPKVAGTATVGSTVGDTATASPIVVGGAANASVITNDMKDKTISLKVGDVFEINIRTIPTPGFKWEVNRLNTTILLELGDPVYTADSNPNSLGGTVVAKFKVVGAGTTPLTLIYVGTLQNGGPSLSKDSFGVTIDAK
jgi:predicted secreted protein